VNGEHIRLAIKAQRDVSRGEVWQADVEIPGLRFSFLSQFCQQFRADEKCAQKSHGDADIQAYEKTDHYSDND